MFSDLIIKNSKPVTIKKQAAGTIDRGIKTPGSPIEYSGELAIFPMSPRDLQRYEAGTYTAEDLTVFVPEVLKVKRQGQTEEEDITLIAGDQFVYKNNTYTLKNLLDYTDIGDFKKYAAKKEVVKRAQS